MSLVRSIQFETPIVLWHSIDQGEPDLPSAVRVYLCDDEKALAESWMDSEGVIVLHAATYSERLLNLHDYLRQSLPDAPVVVMLTFPDMRMDRLLELGVQEVVTNSTELIPAVRTAATRKTRECMLQSYRYYDGLTDLPNRQLFQDRLEHSLEVHKRHRQELGLLILDLDRFFRVNESYTHAGGDTLLAEVAERLKKVTRKSDTLARIGGNTFAVIAENLRQTRNLAQVCEKLCAQLKEPFVYDGETINLSASVGAALAGEADYDAGSLIMHAEQVLAGAKPMGRNNYMVYNARSAEDRIRSGLEKAIYQALDNQQITMAYQPQVSMDGHSLVGAEALMRWNHPIFGNVSPDQFIPVLETTGLIETFGMWALKSACRQFREWLDCGLMPESSRISVNLSPRQFHQVDLADQVLNALSETGLSGRNLTLEITESMVMEKSLTAVDTLARLRFEGVAIAVDDFGTGYSSFAYLKTLPVDYLKIDRDFIKAITTDVSDHAIASSIIHLAHSLRLKVVAEGVEAEDAQHLLEEMGCDEYQGYYFSPPVPAAEMAGVTSVCR